MIKLVHSVLLPPELMDFVIEGMRNPMNSWDKKDSGVQNESLFVEDEEYVTFTRYQLGPNDKKLMTALSNAGTEHRKYLRMMPVYVRITAPLYWWKEFDTYKVGTVANSCSTMHKIQAKEFTFDDFSVDHLGLDGIPDVSYVGNTCRVGDIYADLIEKLEWLRCEYNKTKDKKYWRAMIQLLPSSYNQTRNVMMNYEVLANIYRQRKGHRLDEWNEFCKWIESLPYSDLITQSKEDQLNGASR